MKIDPDSDAGKAWVDGERIPWMQRILEGDHILQKELTVFRHSRAFLAVLVILRIRLSITADNIPTVKISQSGNRPIRQSLRGSNLPPHQHEIPHPIISVYRTHPRVFKAQHGLAYFNS